MNARIERNVASPNYRGARIPACSVGNHADVSLEHLVDHIATSYLHGPAITALQNKNSRFNIKSIELLWLLRCSFHNLARIRSANSASSFRA
jgi:hypothetical protein